MERRFQEENGCEEEEMEDGSEGEVEAQGFRWPDRGQECRQALGWTTKPTRALLFFWSLLNLEVFPKDSQTLLWDQ